MAAGRVTLRRWSLVWLVLCGLALVGALAAVASVAESVQGSPDIIGGSLAVLLVSGLAWSVGAVSTVGTARGRYRTVMGWALPFVGASGGVLLSYAMAPEDPFDTGYGWLVLLGSPACVLASGLATQRIRRRVRVTWTPLLDLVRLAASVALAMAVARAVPAVPFVDQVSGLRDMIGYELPLHLTAVDLLVRWRPDLVFGSVTVIASALYLHAVRRLARDGVRWPRTRSAAWVGGCVVLLLATSSGIGSYAPVVFSVAMVQHVLLMTVVPCLLVLGHGVSLLTRATGASSGPDGRLVRLVTCPLVACLVVALVLFGLFPTGLYAALLPWHWAHPVMNLAFLLAGLVQFWPVLGHSPPRQHPISQLVLVFALMGVHAGFAVWLLNQPAALAPEHYLELPLPYIPDLLADQRLGAILGWVIAELATILAVIALATRWAGQDRRVTATTRPAVGASRH